ncbi:hypothetical protein HYU14_02680 [Candidatus Woesearchaeota archaeon]|nr:hypothetical protein [Candidatus Woesearchaeota archaeon]
MSEAGSERNQYAGWVGDKIKAGLRRFTKPFRRFGLNFRFSRAGKKSLEPTLDIEELFSILNKLNEHLKLIENPSKEFPTYYNIEEDLRPNIAGIYAKLGPYTHPDVVESEYSLRGGTGFEEATSVNEGEYYEFEEDFEKIIIHKSTGKESAIRGSKIKAEPFEILGKKFGVPIPREVEITFPSGYVQRVRYFGYDHHEALKKIYTGIIDKINLHVEHWIRTNIPAPNLNTIDEQRGIFFGGFKSGIEEIISQLATFFGEWESTGYKSIVVREQEHKSFLDGLINLHKELRNYRIMVKSNIPQNILYRHTYETIKTSSLDISEKGIKEKIKITELKTLFERNKLIRSKSKGGALDLNKDNRGQEIEEVEYLLDEYGMEFEVANEDYEFKRITKTPDGSLEYKKKRLKKGTFLLDVFSFPDSDYVDRGGQWRVIPEEYHDLITDVDALEMVNYIFNEWDEYRDDLRDGRYHPHSLTVMDYIMANNPTPEGAWDFVDVPVFRQNKGKNIEAAKKLADPPMPGRKSFRDYTLRFRHPHTTKKGDTFNEVSPTREATNLNPACDFRVLSEHLMEEGLLGFMYIGKKRYYEHVENVPKNEQISPVLTTRGMSMFFIEYICRNGKKIEEIHHDLQHAAKETLGFDYGPRIFGSDLNMDPFSIDITSINKKLRGDKS